MSGSLVTGPAAVASTGLSDRDDIARSRLLLVLFLLAIGVYVVCWKVDFGLIRNLESRDFAIFWIAGKAAIGAPSLVYDPAAIAPAWLSQLEPAHGSLVHPPHFLLLAAPFGMLPLLPAYLLWNALSAVIFAWAARPYMRQLPSIFAVITPAGCLSLMFGQTGLLFGALWLLAFRRHGWAVGLLSLKPQVGFLTIFTLDRRRFLIAVLTLLAALALTFILFPQAMTGFARSIMAQASRLGSDEIPMWYFVMVTPLQGYGIAGWAIFAGAAIVLLWRRFDVFTAATATFLIAPYGIHYDMTVACLGMGLAMLHERRPWALAALTFGFLTPCIVMLGTWFAPPLLLATLLAQVTAERSPATASGDGPAGN